MGQTHQIGAGAVEYSSCTTANWSFQSKVVSIQVISIRTQGVKLHKKSGYLITSKYSLRVNKKNILVDYFSFF